MKTEEQIRERLAEIQGAEHLAYPSATVFENAPLALIQTELETTVSTLEWVLDECEQAALTEAEKI